MKNFTAIITLVFITLLTIPKNIYAGHYSSGEVFYKYIGDSTGVANQYRVFVRWYRNNQGIPIPLTPQDICITSSCGPNITATLPKILATGANLSPGDNAGGWVVPGLDECANSLDPEFKDLSMHKYEGNVILPPCSNYKITVSAVCCRDNSTNLAAAPNMYIEVDLNNTMGHNSSPQIIAPAGKAFCLTQPGQKPFVFAQGALEVDGDSLVYTFANPQSGNTCGPGNNIPLVGGYTISNPIPSSTGIVVDQKLGTFTFSPSQQGSYVMKIDVKEYRFDSLSLQWLYIGNMVREIQIPVTASCNPLAQDGPKIEITGSGTSLYNFLNAERDSMKTAYNLSVIKGADSLGTGPAKIIQMPVYNGYSCFDTVVSLDFDNNVRCSSIDPTDFRLIGPDGVARPIVGFSDNCNFSNTRKIDLQLYEPLDVDGNYLLQVRRGNDGNTLTNECGYELTEFYSALIVVNGCPAPEYQLDGLTVERDLDVRLDWSGNNDLVDANILNTFNSWNIYRADSGVRPMQLLKVISDPSARFFVDSFAPNGYYVDNFIYDYAVLLVYNGKGREISRSCSNINLRVDSSQLSETQIGLYWNHYNCMDQSVRAYEIYRGKMDSSTFAIDWKQEGSFTTDSSVVLNRPIADSINQGSYALKVVAKNPNGNARTDSSESNWVYYGLAYYPPIVPPEPEFPGDVLIPNIITPNGDGINDRFFIQAPLNRTSYEQISLSIYNRHGEKVYENKSFQNSNDRENGWNGVNNNGQALGNGVYFYTIRLNNPSIGISESLNGSITLTKGTR
jgi:gliding motility-associated-like protein